MPQIINETSLGGNLGSAFGTGLGQGLQMLAQHKLGEMKKNKIAEMFRKNNFDPHFSDFLAQSYVDNPQGFYQIMNMLNGQGEQNNGSPQANMEGQQAQQNSQPVSFQQALAQKSNPADEKLKLQREIAEQKQIEPFLTGQAQDYNNAKMLYSKAKGMLENLQKNKNKWPNQYIASITPDKLYKDADIRKYLADSTSLVTALANSRKGQPTNFKLKFEQLSKPDLSMPIETQEALLKDIIKNAENVFNVQRFLNNVKKENNGKYPADIRSRLIEQGLDDIAEAEQAPEKSMLPSNQFDNSGLPDASNLPDGKKLKDKQTGKIVAISKNGKWVKYNG